MINLLIIVVSVIITVFNAQSLRASRETTRMLEKRRQDATDTAKERLGYGMPYPTTTPPVPGSVSSANVLVETYRIAIRRLQLELSAAKDERDKARAELAALKRALPMPPETVRALDDQRRCRELLEGWDSKLDYGYVVVGSATDAVAGCRNLLAEALQAEEVTVESMCDTHTNTVRTYR